MSGTGTVFSRGENPLRADKLNQAISERVLRSGDTMTGPLMLARYPVLAFEAATKQYVDGRAGAPPGTPVNVKSFGAIMDGNSHPLSSQYATLAAAQAVYPHASSLTDEIDWCAIQACINAGMEAIHIPVGIAIINRPITSGATAITVFGEGQSGPTTIVQTAAGQDGWRHTSSQSFGMFDLDFRCTGAGGVALNLNFTGSSTLFTLRSVTISGYLSSTTNYWHDGVKVVGCNRTSISRCLISGIAGGGQLANVGHAIYLAPLPATGGNTASFVIRVADTILNFYQNAITFDCGGRTGNQAIQGVVLDWVNCNQCMRFINALNLTDASGNPTPGGNTSILELVVANCQAQTFGASIYAENAQTVTVRDCMFFYVPNDGTAIAAQLPQDCIQITGGGNYWIECNRSVLQLNAPVNWFLNILGNAGGVIYRDNSVYVNTGATAAGLISVANGCHHVQERGTQFSFWGTPTGTTWQYFVNGNVGGGTANNCSFGSLAASPQQVALSSSHWQNPGAYVSWNYPVASGAMTFMTSKGAAGGGFNFYNATSDTVTPPVLLGSITPTVTTFGQGAGSGAVTLAVDGDIGQLRILELRSAGKARWRIEANNTAEGGSNAGSDLAVIRMNDAGTVIGNAFSVTRSSGQFVVNAGITISSVGGPQWTSGTGSPSGVLAAPKGSLFSRTDGAVGTTLYVGQGSTVWNPVAGV
jgi:hypothetical protein